MSKKHHRNEVESTSAPAAEYRFLIASERERTPGLRHEAAHGLTVGKGQVLHINPSITGFGRLRWLRWDAEKISYELEGRPEELSFEIKVITVEAE